MPIKRVMKGVLVKNLAEGILEHDYEVLNSYQQECLTRFGMTYQMEQEAYLIIHPEVRAMLTSFVKKMVHMAKRKDILKEAVEYFTRPTDIIDTEIRDKLKVPTDSFYVREDKQTFHFDDEQLKKDFKEIDAKHHLSISRPESISNESMANTASSSFFSIITSDTTLPTPEPIPTPEPTLSENMLAIVSNAVDKAIFQHVDDELLRYDTAYVELSKAVEEAMEIPVIEIRQDIAELFCKAYESFEVNIIIKEKKGSLYKKPVGSPQALLQAITKSNIILCPKNLQPGLQHMVPLCDVQFDCFGVRFPDAAERAWEKRMRKKLKRTLRQMNNFKGYETPPTPKSEPSSHVSYKVPPPRPCICHPQYNYNRYPKDRFGIYLPRESSKFSEFNVTVTPAISTESLDNEVPDKKSIKSKKSLISSKSAISKKSAFKSTN